MRDVCSMLLWCILFSSTACSTNSGLSSSTDRDASLSTGDRNVASCIAAYCNSANTVIREPIEYHHPDVLPLLSRETDANNILGKYTVSPTTVHDLESKTETDLNATSTVVEQADTSRTLTANANNPESFKVAHCVIEDAPSTEVVSTSERTIIDPSRPPVLLPSRSHVTVTDMENASVSGEREQLHLQPSEVAVSNGKNSFQPTDDSCDLATPSQAEQEEQPQEVITNCVTVLPTISTTVVEKLCTGMVRNPDVVTTGIIV